MCDCMKEIVERIIRENNAFSAGFEHGGYPHSEIHFKTYTQAGEVTKYFQYISVKWKFCPFCGQEI